MVLANYHLALPLIVSNKLRGMCLQSHDFALVEVEMPFGEQALIGWIVCYRPVADRIAHCLQAFTYCSKDSADGRHQIVSCAKEMQELFT